MIKINIVFILDFLNFNIFIGFKYFLIQYKLPERGRYFFNSKNLIISKSGKRGLCFRLDFRNRAF